MVSADFAYLAAEVGRVDAAGRTGSAGLRWSIFRREYFPNLASDA